MFDHGHWNPDDLNHADWQQALVGLESWSANSVFSPWNADGSPMYGTPAADAQDFVHQSTPFTCAVVSQQMILREFGIEKSEAQLVYDATVNGWLSSAGTTPENAGQLLEYYGVPTHTCYGGDVGSLLAELAQGHKVIAGIDSGEIWGTDFPFEDWLLGGQSDHAIVVTGIDLSDREHPMVYINDPGAPDGAGKPYPLDQFLEAWNDSGRFYVATDDAPDSLSLDSLFGATFNSERGMHLDEGFWANWLAHNLPHIAPIAISLLSIALDAAAGSEGNCGFGDPADAWSRMSDAQRRDLFLNI